MKTFRQIFILAWLVMAVASPRAFAAGESEIKLPAPSLTGKLSVEAAIVAKRTERNFKGTPLTTAQISQLLWAANGNLPADAVSGATSKVVPSAGGLYPLEVYLVTGKDTVAGVPAGVYTYKAQTHSLQLIAEGDNRNLLANACLSQMWLARAPALVVVGGVFARTTARYGNRGVQYVFMEAGNSSQNLYLQAQALGLHAGAVGAFQEAQVSSVLKLPSGAIPLLVVAVGK